MSRPVLRWALAAAAIVGPAALAVALTADPDGPILCGFRALFGIPCPGCGMTRSLAALAHGDVVTAFRVHPAGPVLLAYLGGLWLTAWWSYARTGRLRSSLAQVIPGWAHAAIVLGMLVVWVVRFFGLLGGPASPIDADHALLWNVLAAGR